MSEEKKIRINKFLSERGVCSRRAGDKLIESGRITINGEKAIIGTKVSYSDKIELDGKLVGDGDKKNIYIAFNKPVGIVCTTDTRVEKDNIIDFINYPERIFPIGRLDKPSSGLILLTNDGDIVNKILRTENNHEKEYLVKVDKVLSQTMLERMTSGVPILDTITKNCKIEKISSYEFKIILTQGLNRQIRRMCEYFNYNVVSLKRVRIMNINLDIPEGEIRDLTYSEMQDLNELITHKNE